MAIARVGSITATDVSSGTATWTVNLPTGIASGNIVFLEVTSLTGQTVGTTGLPSGIQSTRYYSQFDDGTVDGQPDYDGDATKTLLAYTVPASPPTTLSLPMVGSGGTSTVASGYAYTIAFSGVDTTTSIHMFVNRNKSGGDGTAVITPAITPTVNGCVIIRGGLLAAGASAPLTAPGGATVSASTTTSHGPAVGIAQMETQTTATTSASVNFTTASSSDFGAGYALALKPTASNAPPTVSTSNITVDPNLVDTFSLTCTAADSDGTIASYLWEDVTGTASTVSGSGSSRTVSVSTYRATSSSTRSYRVTVTDNGGATAQSTMTVTILAHTRWLKTSGGKVPLRRQA